ncbi:uncharacterized protein THITE_2122443 [Thermothielavioides terrestris NRRL 8126]|uniref:SLC26A/SulP transporter domain-containing protein n=1 Tax=Thermothielavioides terrestris (strain ATCC 38088 / NRRL 8126) TaxID=578455 RepID=G2RD96_THETT|nr:uncharacterized protein THITE_2122443 [Thermothielavioides terrestris NRRL 8126]AEO70735.1 hypothetical protein THITE_2122443 [Thermothielavioides terrestris NRRL 8126]
MAANKSVDRLKRFLGIDPEQYRHDDSVFHDDGSYIEEEPSVKDALLDLVPTVRGTLSYLRELFPFVNWIFHYNLTWLLGDFIAGVTVGFVVVPQAMGYALLANLPPEYGLYTSFVGFLLYWAFATSKDITIGAVAVMSTIVGNIVIDTQKTHPDLAAETIARSLALISGAVLLFLGLIRFGFIVEFIPLVAIGSFMTGSALNIAAGQVPGLMGISGVNTRDATYLVIINTLKSLPKTKLDAAMGLTALFGLYFIRWFCNFMGRKYPHRAKTWFFISTLRMAFVVILYILVSWLVNRHVAKASNAKFKILGTVPSGFQHTGAPQINVEVLQILGPHIPTTILVLLIEHIAISKSFGRVNNYIINPSQELVAIGFTNLFGPFLGGYPATGSFSRTAIKAKAGVRTPLAGIFTAILVLLALYALTSVFFYIPSAGLSAIIIHAVGDLITPPREVYKYWKTSPVDVVIFFAGVFVSVFTTIENGIYVTVGASGGLLLFRVAKSPGKFLGKVTTQPVPRDSVRGGAGLSLDSPDNESSHAAFIDLYRGDLSNPQVPIKSPYPGVFIYRFGEGLNYLNSARHLDILTIHIFKHTRRTQLNKYDKIGVSPSTSLFLSLSPPLSPSPPTKSKLPQTNPARTGPPVERPGPAPRQGSQQRRDRGAADAARRHPRLHRRQRAGRDGRAGADRPAQPVRPLRRPGPRRVALRRRHQPLDQARPGGLGLRLRPFPRRRRRRPRLRRLRQGRRSPVGGAANRCCRDGRQLARPQGRGPRQD